VLETSAPLNSSSKAWLFPVTATVDSSPSQSTKSAASLLSQRHQQLQQPWATQASSSSRGNLSVLSSSPKSAATSIRCTLMPSSNLLFGPAFGATPVS